MDDELRAQAGVGAAAPTGVVRVTNTKRLHAVSNVGLRLGFSSPVRKQRRGPVTAGSTVEHRPR